MIELLSLGAGVQSTTVLLMSLEGELPPLDHVVFADTGWEPQAVYKHLEWLKTLCKIDVVRQGNIKGEQQVAKVRGHVADGDTAARLPYFTLSQTGSKGMVKRQCTSHYKIRPIERYIRRTVLGLKHRQHAPKEKTIRQWYGISLDEVQRMRDDPNKFTKNYYPLIEKRMTRTHCHEWLAAKGWTAPRSACIGCPYKHDREWRHLKDNSPEEFAEAVAFDKAIRKCGGRRGDVYLHSQRIPLDEVDLSTDVDRGQLLLWQDECTGMCGV